MHALCQQQIPGWLTATDQVALVIDIISSAAELLQFSQWDRLSLGFEMIEKQLLSLIAAGALAEITFAFHEADSVCGVTIIFDSYNMDNLEEIDLSRLRLCASTTGTGSVEFVCLESGVSETFSQVEWLPPTYPGLAWSQVAQSANREDTYLL
jgi:hypothetical protein